VADVSGALQIMHEENVVHCDIKPANILIRARTDEAVLCDFGLAAIIDQNGPVGGSAFFTAPEVFRGAACPASDVYSLAATLIYSVAGTDTSAFPAIGKAYVPSDEVLEVFPTSLQSFLRRSLSVDPKQRPELSEFARHARTYLNQSLLDQLASDVGDQSRSGGSSVLRIECIASPNSESERACDSRMLKSRPVRDLKKITPSSVCVKTGERVKIRVTADRSGYLTVLNVGPTGNLNILEENLWVGASGGKWECETVVEPPTGRERIFAIWTENPFSASESSQSGNLPIEHFARDSTGPARRATRDLVRIDKSARTQREMSRSVAVIEIDHVG
ncbi:MAG: serine/threonine-protein kinase, partial [Pirellula sp.]